MENKKLGGEGIKLVVEMRRTLKTLLTTIRHWSVDTGSKKNNSTLHNLHNDTSLLIVDD